MQGAGVCGAIFQGAGAKLLQKEYDVIGTCPVGHAGISKEYATNYVADAHGTELNYKAMNMAISCCRSEGKTNRKWKEEMERDHKERRV